MNKSSTKTTQIAGDSYLDLVRRFPLRPIRTKSQYHEARKIHLDLMARADSELDDGKVDYTRVLGRLIRDYDEQHVMILKQKPTPIERLKFLLDEHGMTSNDLGKLVGGSGQASLILNGKRELNKANIRALAERFKVSPAAFL